MARYVKLHSTEPSADCVTQYEGEGGAGFLRNWGSLSEVLVTRGVFLSSGSYNKNPSAMGSLTPL